MTLDYLIEKYIEKTGYGMDMWNKEENAAMTTIAEIILESEVIKLNEPVVSGLLVDFLTWYIHKSEFSKDTYNIKLIVDEYQKFYTL